jgi:hypothetical protein
VALFVIPLNLAGFEPFCGFRRTERADNIRPFGSNEFVNKHHPLAQLKTGLEKSRAQIKARRGPSFTRQLTLSTSLPDAEPFFDCMSLSRGGQGRQPRCGPSTSLA